MTDPIRSRPLDSLTLTVVVDNETDTLSTVDAGVPKLPEMANHLARRPANVTVGDHRGTTVFDHLCVACHGFSVLAQAQVGDERRTVLFDVGPYGDVWLDNAERLGVDLAAIELVFLSHWHWDHSGGLPVALTEIAAARSTAGLAPPVVDVHPDRPDQRGTRLPDGDFALLPAEPSIEELSSSGAEVVRRSDDHLLAGGLLLGSGEIDRVTDYETGLAGHHTIRFGAGEDGADVVAADPLIMDERFVAGEVRGRGVTVLSACSHAGIVNACLGAQARFPGTPIDVVLGGYHLAGGPMEARIGATVDDLDARIAPRVVAPGHCTGWRAKAALVDRFAPDRYGPSAVGATYALAAP